MLGFVGLLARAAATVTLVLVIAAGAGYWLYRDVTDPGPLAATRTIVSPPTRVSPALHHCWSSRGSSGTFAHLKLQLRYRAMAPRFIRANTTFQRERACFGRLKSFAAARSFNTG